MKLLPILPAALSLALFTFSAKAEPAGAAKAVTKVPVEFSGGHETDPRDKGRPVVLIAGALGVPPEVFREAFSHVHPAGPDRGPTEEEARQNKAALMSALGKYGITNDRLDEVSNRYRYVRSRGEIWPTQAAVANALVQDGAVIGFEVVSGGAGYSSPPTVTVPKMGAVNAQVELSYGKDFATNGAVSSIQLTGQHAK
jgi:hypothetical protein